MKPLKRLIRLREVLKFSQREIAEDFGVVHGTVAMWELGKRRISGPVLKLIEIYEEELRLSDEDCIPTLTRIRNLSKI